MEAGVDLGGAMQYLRNDHTSLNRPSGGDPLT